MTGLELAIPLPHLPPVCQGYRHEAPGQAFPAILTWCQLRLLLSLILVGIPESRPFLEGDVRGSGFAPSAWQHYATIFPYTFLWLSALPSCLCVESL